MIFLKISFIKQFSGSLYSVYEYIFIQSFTSTGEIAPQLNTIAPPFSCHCCCYFVPLLISRLSTYFLVHHVLSVYEFEQKNIWIIWKEAWLLSSGSCSWSVCYLLCSNGVQNSFGDPCGLSKGSDVFGVSYYKAS